MPAPTDTSHVEARLFGYALATGDMQDLRPDDFGVTEYALLWRVMAAVRTEYGALDRVLLGDYLLSRHGLDKRDWLEGATGLDLGRPDLMPAYAQSLRDARHCETLASTLSDLAAKTGTNPAALREDALAALNALPITGRYRSQSLAEAMRDAIAEIDRRHSDGNMPGITTGLPTLDQLTGGWQRSDLILIGARPAAGKTALMLNMALAAAKAGASVGIISAEQPAIQLAQRLIALDGQVPAWKLRNPRHLHEDEWKRFSAATARLHQLKNVNIFDASAPDLAAVRVAAKGFHADVIYVDYVQRLKARGEIYERVSQIAMGLKEIARDLDLPVVALAQINRAGAGAAKMEHLKGSGDLEQEADAVLLLERKDNAEVATLELAKNRHGATGGVELAFHSETMRFSETVPGDYYARPPS